MTSKPSLRVLDDPERSLYILSDGDYAGWRSQAVKKEPWTYAWLKDLGAGDVLYDIGANVGSYSLMAGARGALVYAFEPLPVNYLELVANVQLNSLEGKIYCYPIAASSSPSWLPFSVQLQGTPGYGLASAERRHEDAREIYLPAIDLDGLSDVVFNLPTHVKIDVEGFEFRVLSGMQGILSANHVKSVIVEVIDDRIEAQIEKLMERHGYYGEEVEGTRRTEENRTMIYEQEA